MKTQWGRLFLPAELSFERARSATVARFADCLWCRAAQLTIRQATSVTAILESEL